MKRVMILGLACLMVLVFAACSTPVAAPESAENENVAVKGGDDLTFIIVPKCVHEWFDAVTYGAEAEAAALSKALGVTVTIDYRAPATADITEQNRVLEQAAATLPDGIILDPLDYAGSKQVIDEILEMGIPVILFDARVPGSGLTAVGNNFDEQAELEARDLVERIGGEGKIAIMHGVPTAANHAERYETFLVVLAEYPGIEVIEAGAEMDNYQKAQELALAAMAAHPDLKGFLTVDASGPIGISAAIEEAGKQDEIIFVGAENLLQILEFVKSGTMVCSYSTYPQMQGELAVLMAFQAHMGMSLPQFVDTGILYIDETNIDEWLEIVGGDE